ncbi:hypothetical protein N865_19985 [Intrasporangium oryzae NRRL B-24470]|uniref:Uncharacterized protein n=1 Tax=Intrasporangium oryzae NRRL B-24470 TaxID=1386089 RepID=W9G502_9MICO|nr:hypothetical protein [Intrasporangium oryzae]EWS99887.1 hypothetical protein N865_19985 [Intrasporangium oryzae NRRL B-24470]
MRDIQVCAFHGDEGVFGEALRDEAGSLRYTCTRKRGHPVEGPYSWVQVPTPAGVEGVSGLAAELGLDEDLVDALDAFRGAWVEYGVLEREYARLRPETFGLLVKKYGHTAVAAKRYTASAFLGRTLGELSKRGAILWHEGPATGRWSYNSSISWWALPPAPEWSTRSSWAALGCDVEYVPGQTEMES